MRMVNQTPISDGASCNAAESASTLTIEAMVRGYYVYKDIALNDELPCRREPLNSLYVRLANTPSLQSRFSR